MENSFEGNRNYQPTERKQVSSPHVTSSKSISSPHKRYPDYSQLYLSVDNPLSLYNPTESYGRPRAMQEELSPRAFSQRTTIYPNPPSNSGEVLQKPKVHLTEPFTTEPLQ